jgi:HlyD family secretion protein
VRIAATARQQALATIERARAAVELARAEAQRDRQLASAGAAAPQVAERAELEARAREAELASAEFGARIAAYALEVARSTLGSLGAGGARTGGEPAQMDVRSPIDGRVLRVIQASEGVVQAGTPLLELGDPTALEVVVDVLTSDAVRIAAGARVELHGWGGPPLDARVRLVEPSAFTRMSSLGVEEQRVNVVIDLEGPPERWAALGDGYRVEARIVVADRADVLQAPASALFRHAGGWAVYAIREGKAARVAVEVGERTPLAVEILSGLAEGDRVIDHPGDLIADGAAVAAR